MAEIIGLTASLIGIANLGISLTRSLYDFGTTASHAREEIDYISNNVSDYADVLELLVEQLEHDRPIHSKKAVRLTERLYNRSQQLFGRIRGLIPDRRRTHDHTSFLERISWNFKKTRVNHLVGELESLKRTVQLLVQVLCAARQFQAYRDHVGKPEERQKKQETARRQFLRAENVIVEWQQAKEKLPSLREASERDDQLQIQAGSAPTDAEKPLTSEETRSLIKVQGNTLAVIEAATVGVARSETEKRALVLQNTNNWLEQLLDEWTVLAQEQEVGQPSDERGSHRKASNHYSVPAAKTGEMGEATGGPQSPSSEPDSTQYVARGGEKTDVNMGQFTRRRKSSVKRSHGEPTPTRNHDFSQQPEDSNGRFQRAGTTADESRSPKDALYLHFPPPNLNHKHAHSPRDKYAARYKYPSAPLPPQSDPRYFPESQQHHRNGDPIMAEYDAMRGFRSMRNGQSQTFPAPPPPPPPILPSADINTPPTGVPPPDHRSYEHFQNIPQTGFPGVSRAGSARKPAGFSPFTPGGDEPMSQRTSTYTHHGPRRESYFPEDDTPHSPTMARPELATSPLKKGQSSTGLNDTSDRSQKPELLRPSTRYATHGGEKIYVNGVGRSSSVGKSPVERECSSESDSSSDAEPENFASRPKAKLRTRRDKTGTGAFVFRSVTSDGTSLNDQFPPPNHKHTHSPQDEYTARYEYPPPPPRYDPRYFPEPQQYHRNGNLRMDDIGQHAEEHQGAAAETIDRGSIS